MEQSIERRVIAAARHRLTPATAWIREASQGRRTPEGLESPVGFEAANCWCITGALLMELRLARLLKPSWLTADAYIPPPDEVEEDGLLITAGGDSPGGRALAAISEAVARRAGERLDRPQRVKWLLWHVIHWQDRPETTHAEVLEVLDEAAAAA